MGADPASKDAKGLDSMHFAAAHGQLEVVRFLWTKGVELDSEDAGAQLLHGCAACRARRANCRRSCSAMTPARGEDKPAALSTACRYARRATAEVVGSRSLLNPEHDPHAHPTASK